MKHYHAELIKAWADGATIQRKMYEYKYCIPQSETIVWVDDPHPAWDVNHTYRIKPMPDIVREVRAFLDADGRVEFEVSYNNNSLRLTFDGTTKQPKRAEVLQ